MMTLAEGIRHAEECAKSCDMLADISVIGEAKERNHRCAEEHRQLAEWLKELQRYRWIPCNERLPEYLKTVLLSTFWGVRVGFRDHTDTYGDYYEIIEDDADAAPHSIYAWMPLPEPYEPKEEDE